MHTILYGVTSQTLRHVPSERVTSATYVIQDLLYDVDDTDNLIASGSATVDDLSLSTDAQAGASMADPRKLPVSSTTGASKGDPIVVVGADGTTEQGRIAGVVSGDYLKLEQPLLGEYPSGSSVYGTLVSASFPDADAANEDLVIQDRPLRVVWTYAIGGATRKVQEPIYVRRQRDGTAYEAAAIERVRDAYPDLAEKTAHVGDLERWAKFCVEDMRVELLARDIKPELFLTGEQGLQTLTYRLILHMAEQGIAPNTMDVVTFHEIASRRYSTALGNITIGETGGGVVEITADGEQAKHQREYRAPWGSE